MTAAQYDVLAAKSGASAAEIVAKIYGVDNWGFDYFFINSKGNLAVAPSKNRALSLDLLQIVEELT